MRRLAISIAIASSLVPAAVGAQDTRAGLLEQQRAEKARSLTPYQPTRLEKLVRDAEEGRLRRRISPHNGFFVTYGHSYKLVGSGMALGAGFRHDLFDRQARVELEAGVSLRNYQMLRADFSLPRLARERLELGVEATFRRHPQEDFYGLGTASVPENRTDYLFKGPEVQGRALYGVTPWLRVGSRVGSLRPTVGAGKDDRYPAVGDLFDESTAPGLTAQPDFLYGEGFAEVDYRDEPDNARSGGHYAFSWRRYSDRDLGQNSFDEVNLLLQQFVPIFDKKRVFAFQTGLIGTAAADGHVVPFYMQPTVGGSRTIRSLDEFRLRDAHALWLNAEYRWEAFGLLDMALFTDWGTVGPRASDLDFSDMKHAYGIGFRFNVPQAVFLRIDIATGGGEGMHYFFKFSKAF